MAHFPSAAVTTPAPTVMTTTPAVTMAAALVAAPVMTCAMFHAADFDKGGRHSSSDCGKFQNCEQWSKWHHALMGSACEHNCEQVLEPSYVPNPRDPDKIAPFKLQQQFMHSVFAKTLVEGEAANVLCEHLDPRDETEFGDAQKICTNLCNFHRGSAIPCVNTAALES